MRLSNRLPLAAALLLATAACNRGDNCSQIGCLPSGSTFAFRIVDSAGNDLVFGPTARYRTDSMRLIGLPQGEQPLHGMAGYNGSPDSAVYVGFFGGPSVLHLRLNSQDTDTLTLEYNRNDDPCCGTSYALRSLRYNGGAVFTSFGNVLTFRK